MGVKTLLYKMIHSMELYKKYTINEIIELIDTDSHGIYIIFALKKGINLGIIKMETVEGNQNKYLGNYFILTFAPTVITNQTSNK